jgi:hypothetical protein
MSRFALSGLFMVGAASVLVAGAATDPLSWITASRDFGKSVFVGRATDNQAAPADLRAETAPIMPSVAPAANAVNPSVAPAANAVNPSVAPVANAVNPSVAPVASAANPSVAPVASAVNPSVAPAASAVNPSSTGGVPIVPAPSASRVTTASTEIAPAQALAVPPAASVTPQRPEVPSATLTSRASGGNLANSRADQERVRSPRVDLPPAATLSRQEDPAFSADQERLRRTVEGLRQQRKNEENSLGSEQTTESASTEPKAAAERGAPARQRRPSFAKRKSTWAPRNEASARSPRDEANAVPSEKGLGSP